jgi:hypothetical protein
MSIEFQYWLSIEPNDGVICYSTWRETDSIKKCQYEVYADRRNRARPRQIVVGDRVLVHRNQRDNKLTSLFDNRPYIVSQVRGTMITARRQGHTITRNISFYKLLPPTVATPVPCHEEEEEGEIDERIAERKHATARASAANYSSLSVA